MLIFVGHILRLILNEAAVWNMF